MTMTENPTSSQAQATIDQMRALAAEISELDSKLGVTGGKVAQRNALARQITAENVNDDIRGFVAKIEGFIRDNFASSDTLLVAAVTTIDDALTQFADKARDYLDKNVPEVATSTLTEAEKLEASNTRAARFEMFQLLKKLVPMYGAELPKDLVENAPKASRRASGPRGPKVAGEYIYSIDDDSPLSEKTSLSTLANNNFGKLGWSTKTLRDHIVSQLQGQGVSVGETKDSEGNVTHLTLPDTWTVEVQIPKADGTTMTKRLSARKVSNENVDDSDESDDNGFEGDFSPEDLS